MTLKNLLAAPLVMIPLVALAGSIGSESGDYPSVWFRMFNMNLAMGPITTSEAYDAKANNNGTATLGPCSFEVMPTALRLVSGGWYGEVHQPQGQASGSLDCRLSTDVTVLGVFQQTGAPPGPTLYPWSFLDTFVRFDPASDVARYSWTLGTLLTSLDTGVQRRYSLEHSGLCAEGEPFPEPRGCRGIYDDSGGWVSGFRVGERWRVDLWVNLDFDLRAVDESPTLALLALALAPGIVAVRRRRR